MSKGDTVKKLVLAFSLIVSSSVLYAQTIEEMANFAEYVCGQQAREGDFSRNSVLQSIDADIEAHLKILGSNYSLQSKALLKGEEITSLSENILAENLNNQINCKLQVVQLFLSEKRVIDKVKNEEASYAVMDVYFATDRKEIKGENVKERYGSERARISYGTAQVSIPRDHRMGELESPSILRLEFSEDPGKHVVLLDVTTMSFNEFFGSVSVKVKNTKSKNSFIFIHGYNVTFEDAARRTGQIAYDLGFDGAPIFYSWPSHGDTARYLFDEANIEWAQSNIEEFLTNYVRESDSENIYLIAHSMGNRALTRAYISVVEKNPLIKNRFKEVILAAPDIDAEVFVKTIAPRMKEAGNPVTLYASSEDIALKASKAFHGGYPRAGDSDKGIIIAEGIESVDSTNVESGFLGHSYYADERSIISDMFYIINQRLRARDRSGLTERRNDEGIYWLFRK